MFSHCWEPPREPAGRFNSSSRMPGERKKALDETEISYQETAAEQYELPNKARALAQCLEKLAAKGVNLSSIHATASKGGRKAVVVYTVEVEAKAVQAA